MFYKLNFLFIIFCFFSFTVKADNYTLHLLHTNDLHAHIIPYQINGEPCNTKNTACRGGFARIKAFIDSERQKDPNLLLLDAGDRFSGTVFYTLKKGKDIATLMQEMNYDAMTLGNHEFDDGLPELETFMKTVTAPIIASNISFPQKSILNKTIIPALVIHRQGHQIGLISLITDEAKTTSSHAEEITLLPQIRQVQSLIQKLKSQGVNIIILLNHNGFQEDKKLAAQLADIDIIISAHSHTLLSNNPNESKAEGPYPIVIQNPLHKPVLIVSAGIGGHYVGSLSVQFNNQGDILSFKGDTISMDNNIQPDLKMSAQIKKIQHELNQTLNKPIFQTNQPIPLTNNGTFCSQSCYAGEVLTDALLSAVQKQNPNINIAILNAGGIRSALPNGLITLEHIAQTYPFNSEAVIVTFSGKELIDYLTLGVQKYVPDNRTNPFLQTAGLSYDFSAQKKTIFNVRINQHPIKLNKIYTAVIPSFLAKGGDGFPPLKIIQTIPNTTVKELIIKQLSTLKNNLKPFENRIRQK